MTLYCAPRGRTGRGRGPEGSGLYPELAAYRISEGCSPNAQSDVGRLVGLLPIEQSRAELARQGLELDEKAIRRIAGGLGAQMLATRTRDLMRFRRGELPAGSEFKDKKVAVGIDGGRVRVRTVVKKIQVANRQRIANSGGSFFRHCITPLNVSRSRQIQGWLVEAPPAQPDGRASGANGTGVRSSSGVAPVSRPISEVYGMVACPDPVAGAGEQRQ